LVSRITQKVSWIWLKLLRSDLAQVGVRFCGLDQYPSPELDGWGRVC